ncbi:MAG: alpha/beta hydrolase [Comamonadaceae bacterium]|nr:MAG: alpha/beta hydrolase [Comamonadaceae bacterium]
MARRTGIFATIAALGAAIAGCSGTGALNALVASGSYNGKSDVAYGANPRQKLDVYQPLDQVAGGAPVVVFFYGGNWDAGKREEYRFVGEALASGGAITIIPDYRLYPEVTYPEFLRDNAAAMAWAFDHARELGGDPARVYVMGHSAGAYNAAMLALDPRWLGPRREQLAGFIGLAGPYDFLPIENPDTQRAFNWPDTPRSSQPVEYVSAKAPRTLLIAANTDSLVNPVRNTVGLGNKLKAAGVDTTVIRYDNVNHVTLVASLGTPLRFLAPVRRDVLSFLRLNPK